MRPREERCTVDGKRLEERSGGVVGSSDALSAFNRETFSNYTFRRALCLYDIDICLTV